MTPAAHERWQVRVPLLAIALASWALLAGTDHHELAVYCTSGLSAALSLDRLAYAATLHPLGNFAIEWLLMIAAMMMPMLVRPVGHVRARSLPRRRLQAVLIFMAGYCAIWLACGLPIITAMLVVRELQPDPIAAAALVGAIVMIWQASPAKQFCLNLCHSRPTLAAYGIRADIDVFKFGLTQGIWCFGTCWALMLVPLAMSGHHLIMMAAVSAFLAAERMEQPQRPDWSIRWPSTAFRFLWFRLRQISMAAKRA
jgi:predicted metal-binding membrane protein